jgi:hypothetical protein
VDEGVRTIPNPGEDGVVPGSHRQAAGARRRHAPHRRGVLAPCWTAARSKWEAGLARRPILAANGR